LTQSGTESVPEWDTDPPSTKREAIRAAKEWPPLVVRQAHPSIILTWQWQRPCGHVLRLDTGLASDGRRFFFGNRLKRPVVISQVKQMQLALDCESAAQ
jgi:hypothetical protein